MLRNLTRETVTIVHHGFLVDLEAEPGVSIDLLKERLGGACTWVEGVGKTDIEYMGVIPEDEEHD